jgi:hypothetical protein
MGSRGGFTMLHISLMRRVYGPSDHLGLPDHPEKGHDPEKRNTAPDTVV